MSTSTLVSVPPVTATGANVPEDLFERVLVFLDEEVTSAWHWDNEREKRKRELGRCSLTCRYWARRCQPRIFEHIRLPSKYCLDQLLSLLESPLSHVSDYIKHLYLIQHTSDSKSWIHLVPLQLVPKLSLNPTINLDFQGGWGEAYNKRSGHLRSIYYTLHSARPEFSSHISDINLYNLQFRYFADLAHLVGELRSLQTLQCRRVGWSSPVPENYIIPVCPPSLNRVKMYECTENAAGVLFLIGRQRRMPQNEALPVFRLDRNQQLLATRLIQNLVHAPSDGSAQAVFECTIEKVDGVYHTACGRHCTTSHTFLFTPTTNSQMSEVRLETTVIDLSRRDLMIAAMTRDWKKSDTLASRLPDIRKVVLGFDSMSDMSRFMNEVVDTQMDNLREAGKLRYAVFDYSKTGWQWI